MLELKNVILYLALVVVTYFFMEVLTNKNRKLSIVGTILICFSSFIAYRGVPLAIILGELAIISLDRIFKILTSLQSVLSNTFSLLKIF